jgi:hypothetical protein
MSVSAMATAIGDTGPLVSAAANGDINFTISPTDCFAGVQFNTSGNEFESNNAGLFNQSAGVWLDRGLSSEVWVERVVTSGSWNNMDPGTGRWQLSTTRSFRVVETGLGSTSVTGYFKFWDAASGGTLLQQTASATYTATTQSDS